MPTEADPTKLPEAEEAGEVIPITKPAEAREEAAAEATTSKPEEDSPPKTSSM